MSGAEWHGSRRAKSTSGRHEAQLDGACADRARPTSRAVCQAADVRRRMPGLLRICCRPLYRCRPTVQRCRPTIQRCRPTANKVQYVECTAVQCTTSCARDIRLLVFGSLVWYLRLWCCLPCVRCLALGTRCLSCVELCVALRVARSFCLCVPVGMSFVCVFRSG